MNAKFSFSALAAALALAVPATTLADHKIKFRRDLDGDGHYVKKTVKIPHDRYDGRSSYGDHGHRHYPYAGSYGYCHRPYRYGYRSYPYSYPRTSYSVSVYSRPSYYSSSRIYRGYEYSDSLAADVQRELKRRGYYWGPIDGDIGYGSRAAIRAYQRDRGLAVTGRIDHSLLRSLRIS
jgi:hypothetical protein